MKIATAAVVILTATVLAPAGHAQRLYQDELPPLTRSTALAPDDSPLVRAAKLAVAARVAPSERRVVELTTVLTRGRVAQASPNPNFNVSPAGSSSTPSSPPVFTPNTEAEQRADAEAERVRQRMEELQRERERMAAEADEPYGADVAEDEVTSRQSNVQQQIETAPPPPAE
jgi:hypothetical protein